MGGLFEEPKFQELCQVTLRASRQSIPSLERELGMVTGAVDIDETNQVNVFQSVLVASTVAQIERHDEELLNLSDLTPPVHHVDNSSLRYFSGDVAYTPRYGNCLKHEAEIFGVDEGIPCGIFQNLRFYRNLCQHPALPILLAKEIERMEMFGYSEAILSAIPESTCAIYRLYWRLHLDSCFTLKYFFPTTTSIHRDDLMLAEDVEARVWSLPFDRTHRRLEYHYLPSKTELLNKRASRGRNALH